MAMRAGHVKRVKGGRRTRDGQAREVVRDHLGCRNGDAAEWH